MTLEASNESNKDLTYRYTFTFPDGKSKRFEVKLDPQNYKLKVTPRAQLPEWTALENHQCSNCPLKPAESPSCPAAVSMVDVVELFQGFTSYDKVDVLIETAARSYVKRTSLQEAVSSLVGLYMATSGCPIIGKFKPMVRYHLPFATLDETRYRVMSMYLLAQYLVGKQGGTPDWELKDLVTMYEEIQTVNSHFFKRLSNATSGDASVNALVILDVFAGTISFTIDEQVLDELRQLFDAYL